MNKRKRHPLILPVYLPTLILSFGRGMLIPTLPLYAKTFDISYGLVGLVLAAEGIGQLIGDIPGGILLRKIGRKGVMVLGVACVALSVMALFWAHHIYEVLLYRLLAGFGGALWNISRHAYMADATAVYQRGRALSIFGGINRIGTFAGPAVGGAVAAGFGLAIPFLLYGGLAACVIATTLLFFEQAEPPEPRTLASAPINPLHHYADVFKVHFRNLSTAGAGQLFAQMIRAGRHVVVPLYAADVVGLDVQDVGWILSISAFIDMSMFYPAGLIMDRFGRKYAMVPCFFIQAVGMACIPLSATFTGLLLATSLLGFGNGIGSGTMMTLGADLAPKESMGEFLGIWRLIGDTGQMGGPLVVGGVADLLGLSAATLAIAGFGLMAAATFAFLVPETLTRKPPDPA
ncbi:MAG: MFS transporter [bacterium]|nr:MFS transporter [bacterium]